MIITLDTELDHEMGEAKNIAETLLAKYPGHLWAVTVRGGVAIIKAINISTLYGYVLKLSSLTDAGIRTKEVMRAGGEILERSRLNRGAYTGQRAKSVDGIANYQPGLGVQ